MWRGHPFSQRNKKTAGGRRLEVADRGVGQNLKNVDWKYTGGAGGGGGLHNILGVRSPLLTMTHEELFWKKDALIV